MNTSRYRIRRHVDGWHVMDIEAPATTPDLVFSTAEEADTKLRELQTLDNEEKPDGVD